MIVFAILIVFLTAFLLKEQTNEVQHSDDLAQKIFLKSKQVSRDRGSNGAGVDELLKSTEETVNEHPDLLPAFEGVLIRCVVQPDELSLLFANRWLDRFTLRWNRSGTASVGRYWPFSDRSMKMIEESVSGQIDSKKWVGDSLQDLNEIFSLIQEVKVQPNQPVTSHKGDSPP